jgi:hypothetical protein
VVAGDDEDYVEPGRKSHNEAAEDFDRMVASYRSSVHAQLKAFDEYLANKLERSMGK